MSDIQTIKQRDGEYVMHSYGRFPVVIASGKNASCQDPDGNAYIDMTSGIGVNIFGFADEGWVDAVTKQLSLFQHTSNLYYTEPCTLVAEALCKGTGMKKVFFGNSGAEANECAIKAARKYSVVKYGKERTNIVTLINSFHGRTVTTLAATGQEHYHEFFFPFTEGFTYAQAGDIEDVKAKAGTNSCAVMLEIVQGEGGVIPLEKEFVQAVEAFCRENDLLLIIDEVQTGVGRTGSLYAYQQLGITPDIVTSAKGLGGGLPIGAILFGERLETILQPGQHGSTFGGNPVVCAGSAHILSRLAPDFLAEVKAKGEYITQKVSVMPHVTSVCGMGLMLGIGLGDGVKAGDVVKKAIGHGALLLTAHDKVRLLPPLTITYEEIDKALAALQNALTEE